MGEYQVVSIEYQVVNIRYQDMGGLLGGWYRVSRCDGGTELA